MRVLVLSCNTGEGHNAAGRAVQEALCARGHHCDFLDMLGLVGENYSRRVSKAYVFVANRAPRFFQMLYGAGDFISSSRTKSPVYWVNRLYRGKILRQIERGNYAAVVTPHLFPAQTLTSLRREGRLRGIHTVAVATDYTCIPFWEETECDYYVLGHPDLVAEFAAKGIPEEKLLPYGIPVKRAFSQEGDRGEARRELGLPPEGPVVLIMSGSMGHGKLDALADRLLKEGGDALSLVVVCGNNRELLEKLQGRFCDRENIRLLGFTQQVARYMEACDVLLTKPGGLTTTEAAVKGVPMVHTAPIPGCETVNARFFSQREMSVTGKTLREQVQSARILWEEPSARRAMLEAQRRNIGRRAAEDVCDLLERLTEGG